MKAPDWRGRPLAWAYSQVPKTYRVGTEYLAHFLLHTCWLCLGSAFDRSVDFLFARSTVVLEWMGLLLFGALGNVVKSLVILLLNEEGAFGLRQVN